MVLLLSASALAEVLRRHDPNRTAVSVSMRRTRADSSVARALAHNPFITRVVICMDAVMVRGGRRTGWDALFDVLAVHPNLQQVQIEQGSSSRNSSNNELIFDLLRAVQQSSCIRQVFLPDLYLNDGGAAELCTFLDAAKSIELLSMNNIVFTAREQRQQAELDLAAALQRNTNIKTLRLVHGTHLPLMIPICRALVKNVTLKTLRLTNYTLSIPNYCQESAHALAHLLENTTSIQKIEYAGIGFSPSHQNQGLEAASLLDNVCVITEAFIRSKHVTDCYIRYVEIYEETGPV